MDDPMQDLKDATLIGIMFFVWITVFMILL